MRIQSTDKRERLYSDLTEATGENTKSGAIDAAAEYYLKMAGGTTSHPRGAVAELLEAAIDEGSLTAREIADVLDQKELPVEFSLECAVDGDPVARDR